MRPAACVLVAIVLIVGLSLSALRAGTVTFIFSGVEGGLFGEPTGLSLAGGFNLDQDASRVDTTWGPNDEGTFSVYSSPLHQLSGTFGDWTFSGISEVHVADGPEFWSSGEENITQDYWIVRTPVSGPFVNGRMPTRLNLFFYTSAAGLVGSNVLPPHDPLVSVSPENFQFTLIFSDAEGTMEFVSGRLLTLQSVPEPSATFLLVMSLAMLTLKRSRNSPWLAQVTHD